MPCKHWSEGLVARSETECPFCEIDRLRAIVADLSVEVERITAERDNAEKREYDMLGRANSLESGAGKALAILRALADIAAAGNSLTIADDWGFGTATLIDQDGSHTHVGSCHCENEEKNFEAFVNSLHGLLVEHRGLSWAKSGTPRGDTN